MPTENLRNIMETLAGFGWGEYFMYDYDADETADEAPALPDGAIECEYTIIEDSEVLLLEEQNGEENL